MASVKPSLYSGFGFLTVREVAVDLHLLRLTDNVLVAQTAQDLGHQTVAGTVERRVHQLELIGNLLYAVRFTATLMTSPR